MPRRDFERAEIELKGKELELSRQLIVELQQVVSGYNTHFFHTPEHNPHDFPDRYFYKPTYELLQTARETIALRRLMVMPTDACVGQLLESACIESADLNNPHRLGPIRLAARLLSQIEALQSAAS
jgi:hypothetical protein